MSTTFKELYPADSVALTMTGVGALASSSTFVAGFEFGLISNVSNLDLDHEISGKIQVGTTPTINTYIQLWVIAPRSYISSTFVWPDVMDGTASAETWTSAAIRDGAAKPAVTILIDATTSNRDYEFNGISVRSIFGGMPMGYLMWLTHNSGVALNASDGNHLIYYTRKQQQGV